jgi:phosphoglucomutase
MKKQKEAKILSLKNGIEALMLVPEKERKKYYDSLISQYYKEIRELIQTEKEKGLFNELNKKYPELKGSKKKKKTRHRKKKQTRRKKKK